MSLVPYISDTANDKVEREREHLKKEQSFKHTILILDTPFGLHKVQEREGEKERERMMINSLLDINSFSLPHLQA